MLFHFQNDKDFVFDQNIRLTVGRRGSRIFFQRGARKNAETQGQSSIELEF